MPSVSAGSSTTTQTPWGPTAGPLKNIIKEAGNTYKSINGAMEPYWSNIAALSGKMLNGEDLGRGEKYYDQYYDNSYNTIYNQMPEARAMVNKGDPYLQQAGEAYQSSIPLLNENYDDVKGLLNQNYDRGVEYLDPYASGSRIGKNNDYVTDYMSGLKGDITNSIGGQFAAAGRDFSGAHASALSKGLGQGLSQPLLQQYQFDEQLAQQARDSLSGFGLNTGNSLANLAQGTASALGNAAGGLLNVGTGYGNLGTSLSNLSVSENNIAQQGLAGTGAYKDKMVTDRYGLGMQGASLLGQLPGIAFAPLQNYHNLVFPSADAFKTTQTNSMSAGIGMSDRRTKEDIEQIGTSFDGQAIYRFRYKGLPGTEIGFMADEVEKLYPDAVIEGPDGFKRVDYRAATDEAVMAGAF